MDNGTMSWGESVTKPYFTAPIEAHGVQTLTLDGITAAPSPANPAGSLLIQRGCTGVTDNMKR